MTVKLYLSREQIKAQGALLENVIDDHGVQSEDIDYGKLPTDYDWAIVRDSQGKIERVSALRKSS